MTQAMSLGPIGQLTCQISLLTPFRDHFDSTSITPFWPLNIRNLENKNSQTKLLAWRFSIGESIKRESSFVEDSKESLFSDNFYSIKWSALTARLV